PPAPIVWTSTEGNVNGSPAISEDSVSSGTPSRIRAISVEVPPISNDTTRDNPKCFDQLADPTTPLSRPYSTVRVLYSAASVGFNKPPEDCMMRHLVVTPVAVRPCSRR